MSFQSDLPADTTAPAEIRENFRALKEDKIVAADTANTATKLETSHTINGVAFDGTKDITITAEANGGNAATATTAEICSGNAATATKLANARSISLVGDATGSTMFDGSADASITVGVNRADSSAICTGNAVSATKLENARKINGVFFDGTEDIMITQVNGKDIATTDQIPTVNGYDAEHSFTTNGWQKLSNGLMLQWLTASSSADTAQTFSFPKEFPNACLIAVPSIPLTNVSWTRTTFTVDRMDVITNLNFPVIAIGY